MTTARRLSLGVFAWVALWYSNTLTAVHTFDALSYILDVQRKPWTELFHPHHLAYGPLGSLATWFTAGDAALAMQSVNALAGALGSSILAYIVYRRWQRVDLALIAALALSGSYAYWYYAVEVEVYTLAACFLLWIMALIDHPQPERISWRIWLGVAIAGAVLFHQTNVLVGVPLLIAAGADMRRTRAHWQGWSVAAGVATLVIAAWYGGVMLGVSGFRTWADMHGWLFQYANTGWWGGRAGITDLSKGISDAVAWQSGAWYVVAIVVLSLAQTRIAPLTAQHAWMWAWVLTYGAFFTWWEPDNIEFWIAIMPLAIVILLAPFRHHARWHVAASLALGLALLNAYTNYVAISQRGDASRDLQRDIAQYVVDHSQAADLLLMPDGLQELYLPYYHGRGQVLSVNAAMSVAPDWGQACADIRTRITQHQAAGTAVLLSDEFLLPSLVMQQRFGLAQDAIQTCLADMLAYATPLAPPAPIPGMHRIAAARDQFIAGAWAPLPAPPIGWQLINASNDTPVGGAGWQLSVQLDPVVISPIIDVAMPQAIAVRMNATQTADRQAQLFVATALNQFSETASVRWQIPVDGSEVVIDVRDMPEIPSRLWQLRIDPVADGADGTVTIYSVRLIP